MPKILEDCVGLVNKSGIEKSQAYAICTASLKKTGKLKIKDKKGEIMESNFNLIFENIRLKAIDALYQEADSFDEVNRGVALINESLNLIYEILEADGWINHSGGSWMDQVKPRRVNPAVPNTAVPNTAVPNIAGIKPLQNQPSAAANNPVVKNNNNIVLGQSKYSHNLPI
jgi:hypothetical protein